MSTGALSQPQGDVVSPVGTMEMSVGTDVTPGGSYMMAHHHEHGGAGGGGDEHAGHDMSSMDHGGGGGSGSASSEYAGHDHGAATAATATTSPSSSGGEHAGHDMGRRRRSLLQQQNEEEEKNGSSSGKIHFSDDPLDLSNEMPTDYRNWASILSQVLLAKEGLGGAAAEGGDYGEAKALAALDGLTLATRARLVRAAAGDAGGPDPEEPLVPRFHLTDPVFQAADHSGMDHSGHSMGEGKSMISGAHVMSSFINYAPCVLGVSFRFFFPFGGRRGGRGVEVARKLRKKGQKLAFSSVSPSFFPFPLSFPIPLFNARSTSAGPWSRRRGCASRRRC